MSKISIKYGTVSVDYEGTDEFIKNDLLDVLTSVADLSGSLSALAPNGGDGAGVGSSTVPNISVKMISAKLGNGKGSDLARAASAFLTLVQKHETFSQADLLTAMKSATGIYKQSTHGKNLGTIVSTLMTSGFLIETATGTYSVAQSHRDQLAGILAGG